MVQASRHMRYLPLHCACSSNKATPQLVQFLITKMYDISSREKKALTNDREERIGRKTNRFENHLSGGLLAQDSYGYIPLQVLFRRLNFSSSVYTSNTLRSKTNMTRAGARSNELRETEDQDHIWTKLLLVAKETYLARHNTILDRFESHSQLQENVPIVHSILESGASLRIVQQALYLYPNDIMRRDADGATLLMLGVSNVSTELELLTFLLDAEQKWIKSQREKAEQMPSSFTAAGLPNKKGRLPLHQAVISGRTMRNGVRELVDAEPRAVETRDTETGMYPFCLAAIPTFRWDNTCMDTVYELLRDSPHLLQQYV